ncbi:hypothetical protein MRX96_031459 [Rhipicephalus microplus]
MDAAFLRALKVHKRSEPSRPFTFYSFGWLSPLALRSGSVLVERTRATGDRLWPNLGECQNGGDIWPATTAELGKQSPSKRRGSRPNPAVLAERRRRSEAPAVTEQLLSTLFAAAGVDMYKWCRAWLPFLSSLPHGWTWS